LRGNIKVYYGKTHKTGSQNRDTIATIERVLYYLQFLLQAASQKTFGYILLYVYKNSSSLIHAHNFQVVSLRQYVVLPIRNAIYNFDNLYSLFYIKGIQLQRFGSLKEMSYVFMQRNLLSTNNGLSIKEGYQTLLSYIADTFQPGRGKSGRCRQS
jgi:hypothetical protein